MTEMRPIQQEEAEGFLRLLCDVFDLDFGRAQGIFYNEPMFDLNRKWGYFDGGELISILTTVPLVFGWGRAIGIAGVATRPDRRRRGIGAALLCEALSSCEAAGETGALLFARQVGLYERCGFRTLDQVVRAQIRTHGEGVGAEPVPTEEVVDMYDTWATGNANRLRRDERRWNYWKWNFKVCLPFTGGYLCPEGSIVRECITHELLNEWPVAKGTMWFGLTSMAAQMGVPLEPAQEAELILMGRNVPGLPQMFMTDQF